MKQKKHKVKSKEPEVIFDSDCKERVFSVRWSDYKGKDKYSVSDELNIYNVSIIIDKNKKGKAIGIEVFY